MAAFNKINQFVEDLAKKVHNLGTSADQLVIALCASAYAPVATNTVLANLTQIAYTNCSSRNLTISASAQSSGTYKLSITDLVLTASGGDIAAFRYVVIYNDTPTSPADPLIGWYDYGASVTITNGNTFTIDFDGSAGVLTIA